MPSVLKSSSKSGQWMPYPPPATFQWLRCSTEACRSFGYQVRGTLMLRPSISETQSESEVKLTFETRSSAVSAKIPIPSLQELLLMLFYNCFNPTKFSGVKSKISRQPHGFQPEFCRESVTIHVHVGRLIRLVAVEIDSVGTGPEYRRHGAILANCGGNRIGVHLA
jgi:hypothetical protein